MIGDYKKDEFGKWWKMFPDGKVLASEEISDVLNFCESYAKQKAHEWVGEEERVLVASEYPELGKLKIDTEPMKMAIARNALRREIHSTIEEEK